MAGTEEKPFFEFDLGEFGNSYRFKTPDELAAWCDKEIQFWEWVRKVDVSGGVFSGFYDYLMQAPVQIKALLASRQHDRSLADPQQLELRLANVFQAYCQQRSIHSSHPKADAVIKLKESDPVAALTMLAVTSDFFDHQNRQVQFWCNHFPSIIRGIIEDAFFAVDIKGAAESQTKALSELKQEFKEQIHQQADLLAAFEALLKRSASAAESAITEQTKKLTNLHESSTNQFKELLDSAKTDLERYIESVKKRWALDTAVGYWEEKSVYHKKRALILGILWPLVGLLLASGIFGLAWWLSGGLKASAQQGAAAQIGQMITQPNYWHIAVLIIAVTLSIWFLRILVRTFLGHWYRQADAHERVTLIKTYLALLQEGKELVPDDRKIIIQTIFRPSASAASAKDDAAPASPWEFLSRRF